MARAWKNNTPESSLQPKVSDLALLEESLEKVSGEIQANHRTRDQQLREFKNDPVGVTTKIKEVDAKIKDLLIFKEALELDFAEAESQALVAREQAAIAASKANREAGLVCSRESVLLAKQVDAAFQTYLKSISALRANGNVCLTHLQDALVEIHGTSERLHDQLVLITPRAANTGADIAVALANQMQQVIDVMSSPSLENWVLVNRFAPRNIQTVEQAAKLDSAFLIQRFEVMGEPSQSPTSL